ncbi:hypothetical protein C8R31_102296 [Nitrosospira sp. Nsp2]|uniref:esterase-like activity of phytase family protein n=1 Tax=Nitrosospira sp. Nsp2 TaxID=136548 RepID=UPI000D301667|nr:esterase-like activity of phytase family protein [Nitrosospira sp. Nsp2]PTR16282.1 hypothetical protein C8R31_102296 [Nitrosospira sp. Nsp2]
MRRIPLSAIALAASLAIAAACAAAQPGNGNEHGGFRLNYIGHQLVPNKTRFNGTTIGGLSSLDYDSASDRYITVSDDRSNINTARFYQLSLDLALFTRSVAPGMEGVVFHSVTTIQQPDGSAFKSGTVDPEGLRFDRARNKIYWSDEGQRGIVRIRNPAVREMNPDGSHSRDFSVPYYYYPRGSRLGIFPGDRGVYSNLAFESLALSIDRNILYTATENGLIQDAPPANIVTGSRSRILSFDIASGASGAEYVYNVDPVAFIPASIVGFATNGLTDFVAIGDRQFITIERAFTLDALLPGSNSTGYTIHLYYADARNATDISGMPTIAGFSVMPVRKTLLLDLSELKNDDGSALAQGNIEGITLGPIFNGKRTVILVADNNFSRSQLTQFIAFEISPE